jgi:maltooligosyltrehalose synthase
MPEGSAALDRETAERGVAELVSLVERSAPVRTYVDWLLTEFSAGDEGRYRMRALLDVQNYALAFWRRGAMELNYRRFFDVDELVAVRQEEPAAFDATHARVLAWIADGTLDGLRVDHVDGLSDPLGYLERLRDEVEGRRPGVAVPIFVEKILSPGERLRDEWPWTAHRLRVPERPRGAVRPFPTARRRSSEPTDGSRAPRPGPASRRPPAAARSSYSARARRRRAAARARAAPARARARRRAPIPRAALRRALEQLIVALPVYRTYVDARASGAERGVARVVDEDLA